MADDDLTFTGFSVELMERSHARVLDALDGLTDEQLWFQPAPGSNSIGWLVWHLSRFKDIQTSRVAQEEQVWISDGWADKFGMRGDEHGMRDTPDQVAAFRADRSLILAYAEAAHQAAVRRAANATDEQLHRWVESFDPGRGRYAYQWLLTNGIDYTEHTGQIAYLRGVLTGPGWSKTMP